MNLMDKIEEIRQKPEHERLRYVWFMVGISMLVIIFVWAVSFKSMFRGNEQVNSGNDVVDTLEIEKKDILENNSNENK